MPERDMTIAVRLTFGSLVPVRNPATGTTFNGYSPNVIGQAVASQIMQMLRAGERILAFDVGVDAPETAAGEE